MFGQILGKLIEDLKRLPGIGNKSAQRLAMFLLNMEKEQALQIADSITLAVQSYRHCSICNMLTETDPCFFCSDPKRNDDQLCIVENTQDVFLVEKTQEFKGRYFVLNALLSPLDGVGPAQIDFPKLKKIIQEKEIKEIILALNPSTEGESTINFLVDKLQKYSVMITRLSTGIPFGGDLEYISSLTLTDAMKRRYEVRQHQD